MTTQSLAVHETLELHELLAFKNVCLTKSKTMQALVTDEQLKSLMELDVQQASSSIKEYQALLSKALK
jgi:similar to spore coat protein